MGKVLYATAIQGAASPHPTRTSFLRFDERGGKGAARILDAFESPRSTTDSKSSQYMTHTMASLCAVHALDPFALDTD